MKTINQLIQGQTGGGLAYLVQRSRLLQHIDELFQTHLPLFIGQHCRIVNIRDKTLVIHTDSAAWASRLRYMIPELLDYWQADKQLSALDITEIDIKIRPLPEVRKIPQAPSVPKISAQSAALLRRLADSIAHPELKSVLLSLADKANKE